MKIKSFAVENARSFRDREEITLNNRLNILVGPNGGGKSNLLDIINAVVRRFIHVHYSLDTYMSDSGAEEKRITPFPIARTTNWIDTYLNSGSSFSSAQIVFGIDKQDIQEVRKIESNFSAIQIAAQKANFKIPGGQDQTQWQSSPGYDFPQEVEYQIRDHDIKIDSRDSRNIVHNYLHSWAAWVALSQELQGVGLGIAPKWLYLSAFRLSDPAAIYAMLSTDSFNLQLKNFVDRDSKSAIELLKLATIYFATKRRNFEISGNLENWKADSDVERIDRYLEKLGFQWEIQLRDKGRNQYVIELARNGQRFEINRASSGEKELLSIVFGIFALHIQGGVVLFDEPEVHLHPQSQRLLLEILEELAEETNNQIILATHSPTFITPRTVGSVHRVYLDSSGTSRIVGISLSTLPDLTDLTHIVNSHNNERIFFADRAVLVEGISDMLVFSKLFSYLQKAFDLRGVVEVVSVGGKTFFARYQTLLAAAKVSTYVIADQDYSRDIGSPEIKNLFTVDDAKIYERITGKKNTDRVGFINVLRQSIEDEDVDKLKDFLVYISSRVGRLKDNLSPDESRSFKGFVQEQRLNRTFILEEGEIEVYLPEGYRTVEGIIELTSDEKFVSWLNEEHENRSGKLWYLANIVFDILEVPDGKRALVFDNQPLGNPPI